MSDTRPKPEIALLRMIMDMPASADLTRRILVPVPGQQHDAAAPRVRRYKMARMAPVSRTDPTVDRFAHLRRSYD
jgi:hypothetical protein